MSRQVNRLTGKRQWKEEALLEKVIEKLNDSLQSEINKIQSISWGINTLRIRNVILSKEFVKQFFDCKKKSEIISYLGEMAMYSNPLAYLERFIEKPYFELDTSYAFKKKVFIEKIKLKKKKYEN